MNYISRWYVKFIAESGKSIIWSSLFLVLAISFIDLSGDIIKIHPLKGLEASWIHMSVTTSVCFIFTVFVLIIILTERPAKFRRIIGYSVSALIVLISLLTIGANISILINGNGSDIQNASLLKLFLVGETQMPIVLACIFLLIGSVLILISYDTRRTSDIAHAVLFPAALASYFIPVTYFLGVYHLIEMKNFAIGFTAGLALCSVCIAILFIRPDTWLMAVFTSKNLGGIMARKLLPALMILSIVIGRLRIMGEQTELFNSEKGVALVALVYTACFILLVWISARSVNRTSENLQQEIEERKKAEKLLEKNKVHLEMSQEIANLGSWELDILMNRLTWSDEVYRIFGLAPGEFEATYEAFLDAVHPDDRTKVDDAYSGSLKENKDTYEIEHRVVRKKTGEIRFVHEKCKHFRDPSGRIIRSMGMVHDITSRKRAEIDQKESKEKLDIALAHGNIGIWEWNLQTDELILDTRMEKIFGLEPETFKGTYNDFENLINEEDLTHFKKAIKDALNEDIPFETIFRIKIKNEEDRYINAKAMVQKDSSRGLAKMIGVCFDITGIKRGTEQVLFDLNEELLRSNKELEHFAYVASHDLQEPLRMISTFTQLLSIKYKNKLDQDAQEYISFAVNGAVNLQNQINDLLALSRIQTKGKEFSLVDLNKVLEKAISPLLPSIEEKNARITTNQLDLVNADELQMVQLLQNLIGNALKYSIENPRIHISSKEEGDYYLISVKDNGIGVEPQYSERIFQIFQRLHSKDEYEGSGIGLAICKRIVERHKGKIWVESEQGKGSTFYFTIPKSGLSVYPS
jgi:PAS domain S-box-containing protein